MALTMEQSLRQAIDREKAKLTDLAHNHNESWEQLAALKAELAYHTATDFFKPRLLYKVGIRQGQLVCVNS